MDTPRDAPPRWLNGVPVAPRWHTSLLVSLYVLAAALGAALQRQGTSASVLPGAHGRIVTAYLPLLLVQWGVTFYVCRVGRTASALRALLGAPWDGARRVAVDLALALGGFLSIKSVEALWAHFAAGASAPSVTAVLPQTPAEQLAWVVVAVSVGVCEELVFRGYLLTQFEAFTGRAGVAVAIQAVIFGLAHGEQGAPAAVRVALYGVGLGALARGRGSLAPCIVCHVGTDLASGLLRV